MPHCHRSQNDFIMSLNIISDIFSDSDSQSAMFLPLKLSQCIVYLLSTLRCTKANLMRFLFVLGLVPQQTCSSDHHGSSWGDPCNVFMSHIEPFFFQWQGDKIFAGCRFSGTVVLYLLHIVLWWGGQHFVGNLGSCVYKLFQPAFVVFVLDVVPFCNLPHKVFSKIKMGCKSSTKNDTELMLTTKRCSQRLS